MSSVHNFRFSVHLHGNKIFSNEWNNPINYFCNRRTAERQRPRDKKNYQNSEAVAKTVE